MCCLLYDELHPQSPGGAHLSWQIVSQDHASHSTLLFLEQLFVVVFKSATQMSYQSNCFPWTSSTPAVCTHNNNSYIIMT